VALWIATSSYSKSNERPGQHREGFIRVSKILGRTRAMNEDITGKYRRHYEHLVHYQHALKVAL